MSHLGINYQFSRKVFSLLGMHNILIRDRTPEFTNNNSDYWTGNLFSGGAAYRTGVQVGDKIIKVGKKLFLLLSIYGLLTKCEVKMAGYWLSSFFACLWTETKLRSINLQKKNKANFQPS